jgi:hypothetical protein
MYLVIRKYNQMRSVRAAAQRAETGLVAILRRTSGFCGYCVFDAGGGVGGSVALFTDRESAEAANARVSAWVQQSLLDLFDGEPEIIIGDVVYSSVDLSTLVARTS